MIPSVLAPLTGLPEQVHGRYVQQRRVRVLAEHFAGLLPTDARVLDVGCGDGWLAAAIARLRPDVQIRGIDVLVRPAPHVPVEPFDGQTIPYPAGSFDIVMMCDVLHHTDDPLVLLRESLRVAKQAVLIKDHTRDGFLAGPTLRFMDRVGNCRYGVALPYNYWPKRRWLAAFDELGARVVVWRPFLGLYPFAFRWLFERSLHFIASLEPRPALGAAASPLAASQESS